MNEQLVTLDLCKDGRKEQYVRIGQGDKSGTTIVATVYNNGVQVALGGLTPRFKMRLPYNAGYVEGACTLSGNSIRYVVDEEHCAAVPGTTSVAYFELLQGDSVIASTSRFNVIVLPDASEGVDPAKAWTNGVTEFLDDATERVDDVVDRAEGAIEAIGEIIEVAVPVMTPDVRGGAKLGDGLSIGSNEKLSVIAMTNPEVDAAVNGAFSG